MTAHGERPRPDDARVLVGLMSGTSADGIDAAVVSIRGPHAAGTSRDAPARAVGATRATPGATGQPGIAPRPPAATARPTHGVHAGPSDAAAGVGTDAASGLSVQVLAHHHVDFDERFRLRILGIPDARPAELARLHRELGERFGDAADAARELAGVPREGVAAVVCAGLTAAHLPPDGEDEGGTLVLGDADVIAARTGCAVLSDLRATDRAAGGHGAPLVPWADAALLRRPDAVVAALNLGGIGNVTLVPPSGPPVAFDTGPGNMALDGALAAATGGRVTYDEGGALGLAGRVDETWLAELVAEDDFLRRPPPRSTGRERYGAPFLARHAARLARTPPPDLAATLAAYTVHAVADALAHHVPARPSVLVVSGGGALNRCLMHGLARALPDVDVTDSARALGIPVLAKEAVAFALLGDATLRGVPSNVPSVTGARRACVLGRWSRAPS